MTSAFGRVWCLRAVRVRIGMRALARMTTSLANLPRAQARMWFDHHRMVVAAATNIAIVAIHVRRWRQTELQ